MIKFWLGKFSIWYFLHVSIYDDRTFDNFTAIDGEFSVKIYSIYLIVDLLRNLK